MTPSELADLLKDRPDLRELNPNVTPVTPHLPAYLDEQYEHDIQAAVVLWARGNEARWPELELLYAVPNGGYRHPATAAKLKAEGVRASIPDIVLPVSRKMDDGTRYNALFIELKRKGGRLTPGQQEMIRKLQKYGNLACVCFGVEDAISTLEFYLNERG